MVWVKLEDQIAHHPKFTAAGAVASWLWVCGNCHCNKYLTDGFIKESALATLGVIKSPAKYVETLVRVGLWERVEGGYQVHDFLQHNPSKDDVTKRRAEDARRKRGGLQPESDKPPHGIQPDSNGTPRAGARVPALPVLSDPGKPKEPNERAPTLRAARSREESRQIGEANEDHAFRQLCVIARKELLGLGLNESDFIEGLKERAARAGLYYTGRLCQKACDAVHVTAQRQPA